MTDKNPEPKYVEPITHWPRLGYISEDLSDLYAYAPYPPPKRRPEWENDL